MAIPFYADECVSVFVGDCLDVLATLDAESVDAVVCDPPYALGFMGQAWDTHTPGGFQHWCEAWAAECLRVLKPGGHLLAFGGTRTYHRLTAGIEDAGFEIRDSLHWIHGQGFPKGKAQLKPAHEPIVLARKKGPLWLNVDGCRVAYASEADKEQARVPQPTFGVKGEGAGTYNYRAGEGRNGERFDPGAGRWPANVLLDGEAAGMLDEQSGELRPGERPANRADIGYHGNGQGTRGSRVVLDKGGASRFFPVFRYQAKAGKRERPEVNGVKHPTVKPVELMRWLVRLVTPPGGLVLDPFAGSGATLEAALLEGVRVVAVEREPDYVPLIMSRLDRRPTPVREDDTLFPIDAAV